MIGRIIEEEGQKVIQTLAGATAGTVCKVNYGSDSNYAIPITLNEAGEGYVGVSCACPGPFYNPATGTLTVDNICSTSSNAECADKVLSNSLSGDTVYNLAIWCATSDGNYNSMGFSGGRSITYNPYTATLNACNGNFTNSLSTDILSIGSVTNVANAGIVFTQNNGDIGEIDGSSQLVWCNPVIATCFCGNLCGLAAGTVRHCRFGYTDDYDFDVALENYCNTCLDYMFVSACCRLRYRNTTGTLRITNADGNPSGTICAGTISANKICAGECGIQTCYDIVGFCNEEPRTMTWYIYCDGSACICCADVCGGDVCLHGGSVYVCDGECEVISTANIGNYLTCQCRVSLETYLACTSLCSNVLYLVY